ncbi:hypothetical protein KIH39_16910 [Telmatocola sphagniphila]|uniref:Anti sigma-E protein RseA N-terminal domain-containing protein n=1 Tax=Telmatocola sphagniphila TaxID=1123043 RepID=A0A8E6B398_9BACT|nr:RseA family anti-sigma factor [Telmatocola sphagniphila]QVL30527.1 hypothetical protein KIH39_16910 [Telmatocola sphagniphila]
MLKAKDRELISAYIDGELNPAEKASALRLIAENPEAGQLHAAFLTMRGAIRRATEETRPISVQNRVIQKLNSVKPANVGRTARRIRTIVAIAASLLLFAGVGIFYSNKGSPGDLAKQSKPELRVVQIPTVPEITPETVSSPQLVQIPRAETNREALPTAEILPAPREVDEILANPFRSEVQFNIAPSGRLPLLFPLKDLEQDYPFKKLVTELSREEIVRVDIFTRDIAKASETLQTALKARNLVGHVDSRIAEAFKRKQLLELVFFTESLNQSEIANLLQQLGKDDVLRASKTKEDTFFGSFVFFPHQVSDLERLSRSIGVPTAQLKLNRKVSTPIDPKQPLELNTGSRLTQGIRGNAKIAHQFLVVPLSEKTNLLPSKESRQFLDQRGDNKPDVKPLIVILRPLPS